MPRSLRSKWPKAPLPLSPEQEKAREDFMFLWHKEQLSKYSLVEAFNHGALTDLPSNHDRYRTLEIGAGIGGHLPFENLALQEYHCLEMRANFCAVLRLNERIAGVHEHNIEERTPFHDASFDRVVAIHVLEHLRNLPAALAEIARILAKGGIFDVVLPCEGGIAYSIARRISAKRFFERNFEMSYDPIIANEHVNTLSEVLKELSTLFVAERTIRFPFNVPVNGVNLCIAIRMRKRPL